MTTRQLVPATIFRFTAIGLVYTALFLLLTKYSATFTVAAGVMVWYAPAGLNIALLMIFGLRYAPVIFLAGLLGGLWILAPDAPPMPLIVVALTTPVVEAFAVCVVERWLGGHWQQWTIREFIIFIFIMMAAPVFVAAAGIANYCSFGMISWSAFWDILLGWWIGDVIGILTVTPLFLFVLHPAGRRLARSGVSAAFEVRKDGSTSTDRPLLPALAGQIIAVSAALWFCFRSPFSETYHLFYLCFLPLIWIVFSHGLPGAAMAVSALNTGATMFAASSMTVPEAANLQFFLMMLSLTGLILGKLVSENKRVEEARRQSEEELREITNNFPGMVYRFVLHADGSYSIPYVSEQVYEYSGKTPEQIVSDASRMFQSVHPEDLEKVQQAIIESSKTLADYQNEHRLIGTGGKIRWFDVRSSPRRRENGEIVWSGVAIDITDRKRVEEAYRTLVDNSLQALAIYQNDKIVFGNTELARMTGYELDEIYGMNAEDLSRFVSKEDREQLWRDLHNRLAGKPVPPSREFRVIQKDGSVMWVRNFAALTTYRGRSAVQVAYLDVTDQKRAEERLRFQARLLETVQQAVIVTDMSGRVIYWNPFAEELYGWSAEEALGKTTLELISSEEAMALGEEIMEHLQNGRAWRGEYLVRHRTGTEFHIGTKVNPIHDEEGRITGMIGVSEDITERKRTEQQLIQADKMASLGLLSAGVAHEINNPVNLILLNTSLLKDIWRDFLPVLEDHAALDPRKTYGGLNMDYLRSKLAALVDDVHLAARRIESTVGNLKHFAKKPDIRHREPVHVNTAVENAVKLATSTLKKSNVGLKLDLHEPLPPIDGNLQNVEQILLNLMINAVQARDGKNGTVAIRTAFDESEKRVTVRVADFGKGVDPAISGKLFDPFVTTRLAEGGTGLGLAIVYNLVKSLGGDIDFESETGKGTVFKVSFPTAAGGTFFGV